MKFFSGIVLIFLLSLSCTKQKAERPNIVFISVDDLRPELGAYGNSIIRTPVMDKLAGEGTLFLNHFVQVPTCGASRYTLFSGKLPRNRQQAQNSAIVSTLTHLPESDKPESFVHALKRQGYYTVGIGKLSHSADGRVYGYNDSVSNVFEMPHSWDQRLFDSGKWGTGWNAFFGYADGSNRQSRERKVLPYERADVSDDGFADGLTANLAVEKLKELSEKDQPFFLGVGFFKPHLPFTAPEKYWKLYDRASIPVAEFQEVPQNTNEASLHHSNEFNGYLNGPEKAGLDTVLSAEYARTLIHAYYACVSYIDAQIGRILDELKRTGLSDNTIIVVWGDHGWHLGDQRIWGKHTLLEKSLRSVLIVKVPGSKPSKREEIVSTIDIYPTLMELTSTSVKTDIDGHSLSSLIDGTSGEWRDISYGYFRNGITMRTPRYRLTQYFNRDMDRIELFDLSNSKVEQVNSFNENTELADSLLTLLKLGNTGIYQNK